MYRCEGLGALGARKRRRKRRNKAVVGDVPGMTVMTAVPISTNPVQGGLVEEYDPNVAPPMPVVSDRDARSMWSQYIKDLTKFAGTMKKGLLPPGTPPPQEPPVPGPTSLVTRAENIKNTKLLVATNVAQDLAVAASANDMTSLAVRGLDTSVDDYAEGASTGSGKGWIGLVVGGIAVIGLMTYLAKRRR
jgi:hypothetical protein